MGNSPARGLHADNHGTMNTPPDVQLQAGPSAMNTSSSMAGPASRVVGADPGTRKAASLAWIVVLVLGSVVMLFQQFSALSTPAAPAQQGVTPPEAGDQPMMAAKLVSKLIEVSPQSGSGTSMLAGQAQNPSAEPGSVGAFRNIIVRSHIAGKSTWPGEVQALSTPPKPWAFEGADEDIAVLTKLLSEKPTEVSAAELERLVTRHGFFGQLAGVMNSPPTDPARAQLLGGGGWLMFVTLMIVVGLLFAFLAAIACSIIAVMKLASRSVRWRMTIPSVGGSVLIETVAVFIAGFCTLKLISFALEATLPKEQQAAIGPLTMGLQWCLLLAPLWPLVRGVSWQQLRQLLGLHTGEGLFKEIGCGLFAYFAGLPLVFIGIVISVLAIIVQGIAAAAKSGGTAPPPPSNPILEYVTQGNVFELAMLFALASIWAPLVEELVFRGALFRHLRGSVRMIAAGLISAAVFALMHGYPFFLLGPVMMLGFNFAIMREWRGSLVAPIVMHCLHNATTLLIVISLMRALA
jgi:membrane protease YdiL (CAAX protease family)